MTDNALILYTIGHGNQTADSLLALLRQHEIRVVLDVRSAPYSKYVPHFNKAALQVTLGEAGFDYRFAGDHLGGRPKQLEMYRQGTQLDANVERDDFLKLVDYEAVMQQEWYRKGITRLMEIMQGGGGVVCLCSETDSQNCHRHHLIARSLLDPSVKVVEQAVEVRHILKDGALQVVTEATFAHTPRQMNLF
jgi:uncharacterized protein (DUF488 family)